MDPTYFEIKSLICPFLRYKMFFLSFHSFLKSKFHRDLESKNSENKCARTDDAYTRYTQRFQNGRTHGAGKALIYSIFRNI